jgi:hypothetical protein
LLHARSCAHPRLRLQWLAPQIQAAAATLRRASVATRGAAERSQRFYSELAQLQHSARLLPAPGGGVGAGAAFLFDVSFPGLPTPPADVHVLVAPSETVRRLLLAPVGSCPALADALYS